MKIRVLQGHSICYGGEWFNQGAILDVPYGTKFETNEPAHDEDGKYLGARIVSQVEEIPEAPVEPAETIEVEKQPKEEG